jgi:ParB family chromosome partitioning protein
LKTWPEYYEPISTGAKTFEIRKHDRDFKVGDILKLEEFEPTVQAYTGRAMYFIISYILAVQPFVPEGYVCMAIHKL